MNRIAIAAVAVLLSGPTLVAASRAPSHAVAVHRARVVSGMAVHARPFGRASLHSFSPRRPATARMQRRPRQSIHLSARPGFGVAPRRRR
jgi:hypothetical protein